IDDGQAYNTSSSNDTTLIDAGVSDMDASITITWSTGDSSPSLVFRALDNANRLNVVLEDGLFRLWMTPAGGGQSSPVPGASASFSRQSGVPYRVRVVAEGDTIDAYIDDEPQFSYTLT